MRPQCGRVYWTPRLHLQAEYRLPRGNSQALPGSNGECDGRLRVASSGGGGAQVVKKNVARLSSGGDRFSGTTQGLWLRSKTGRRCGWGTTAWIGGARARNRETMVIWPDTVNELWLGPERKVPSRALRSPPTSRIGPVWCGTC